MSVAMCVRPRLHDPDSEDPRDWTLRRCFVTYKQPELLRRQAGSTLTAYLNMLGHWERWTSNPRVGSITRETLEQFRERLEKQGYPPATVKKLGTLLRALLRRLSPAATGNPQGEGIIEAPPYLGLPHVGRKLPRNPSDDEINRVYAACRVAEWPRIADVPAPDVWRAVVCAMYNLGPRAWDLWCDGSSPHRGWFWRNYQPYRRSETGTPLRSISFLPNKTGDELLLPVHPVLEKHLELIRSDRRTGDIFPATKHHGSVYDQWTLIKSAAGVGVEGTPDLDFHDLRKRCQTEWDWLRDGVPLGDWILGHAPQDVGGRSYRNLERHAADACESLPQPAEFLTVFERVRRDQLKLF